MREVHKWRYAVDTEGTITRGRIYNTDDWDAWRNYWDGDEVVAFTDRYYRGIAPLDASDEDTARAMKAHIAEKNGERGSEGALDRVAQRIAKRFTGLTFSSARFICVDLDYAEDFFVLSFDGDPNGTFRREIEAVWNGEIYREECEIFDTSMPEGQRWQSVDDPCEEWYGEANAEEALSKMFPLEEFPAERLVEGSD